VRNIRSQRSQSTLAPWSVSGNYRPVRGPCLSRNNTRPPPHLSLTPAERRPSTTDE